MTLSEYTYLKNEIKVAVCSSERYAHLLATLKDLFKEEISSPRRFEQITSIGKLLEILELRDVLSEDCVDPIMKIVLLLPNADDLTQKILQYKHAHIPRDYRNAYTLQRNQEIRREPTAGSIAFNNPFAQMSPKKRQRIVKTVVEKIGSDWRDLARNLGIRECKIDNIDHACEKLQSKAANLVEFYLDSKADPDNWFLELCDGLDKTRRKDLSKDIKKVVAMNL